MTHQFIPNGMATVARITTAWPSCTGAASSKPGRAQIFEQPQPAYTRRPVAAVPIPDPLRKRQAVRSIAAELPSNIYPSGYEPGPARYRDVGDGHEVLEDEDQ